jgi:hypothetical protein
LRGGEWQKFWWSGQAGRSDDGGRAGAAAHSLPHHRSARRALSLCRAIGVTPRTLEVWDDIGIAREMIDAGIWITGLRSIIEGHPPKDEMLELSDLPYGELVCPNS